MLSPLLTDLGLEHNEPKLYIESLKIGSTPASVLARRCDIPRSSAHFTCQQLVKKGLMFQSKKKNTIFFTPETPQKLKSLVEEQKSQIRKRENLLDKFLPELENIYNPSALLPKVEFYEGIEAFEKTFSGLLDEAENNDEIVSFVKILDEKLHQDIYKMSENFIQERISRGITTRVLAVASPHAEELKNNDKNALQETRIIKNFHCNFRAGEIFFHKNKIYTITIEDEMLFGFVVNSSSVYEMYKSLFETIWEYNDTAHSS